MNEKTAYLAGIIDGEGTIYAIRRRRSVRVYVVNTDERLIRWLEREFGGLVYRREPRHGWKAKFEWHVVSRDVSRILTLVLPYLVIKREQAELGLAVRSDVEKYPYQRSRRAYRAELCEKIHRLNQGERPAATTKPDGSCESEISDSLNSGYGKAGEPAETSGRYATAA